MIEEEQNICNLYQKECSMKKLSKQYKKSIQEIRKLLLDNNIAIKNPHECHRKYFLNNSFLDNELNWTEKQAYFLGWLASDGCLTKRNDIQITVQKKDGKILHIIKDILNYTGPIKISKRKNPIEIINGKLCPVQDRYKIDIRDLTLAEKLKELGFSNKKSENFIFPDYIKNDLMGHFLRGYLDGDGGFHFKKKKDYLTFKVSINGTTMFCLKLKEYLKYKLDIESSIYILNKNKNSSTLIITGHYNCLKLLNYIYENAHFALKRKLYKFLKLINRLRKRKKISKFYRKIPEYKLEIDKSILIIKYLITNARF